MAPLLSLASSRRVTLAVVVSGAVSVVFLAAGLGSLGGLLALVHLGGLVGAPMAALLASRARSVPVTVVLSIALSVAVTAVAAQSLLWFDVAHPLAIVAAASAYGVVLAELLPVASPAAAPPTTPPASAGNTAAQ